MLYMCQVNTNCEWLIYIYLMNGLLIFHMLRACDVSNTLEYKPSLKLLTIREQDGRPRIMYTRKEVLSTKRLECGSFPCARKFEVGCLNVKIKLLLATLGL